MKPRSLEWIHLSPRIINIEINNSQWIGHYFCFFKKNDKSPKRQSVRGGVAGQALGGGGVAGQALGDAPLVAADGPRNGQVEGAGGDVDGHGGEERVLQRAEVALGRGRVHRRQLAAVGVVVHHAGAAATAGAAVIQRALEGLGELFMSETAKTLGLQQRFAPLEPF